MLDHLIAEMEVAATRPEADAAATHPEAGAADTHLEADTATSDAPRRKRKRGKREAAPAPKTQIAPKAKSNNE